MTNWLSYGLILWLLTSCAIKPERGPAGGSDVVKPLWEEVSLKAISNDTPQCTNVVALLIGIGQYDPKSGWEPLQAQNDVAHMAEVLRKQGVAATSIHQLLDQQATHAGITQALQKLADTLRRGSRLIILYGGHARQIPDDNGDEADGYDEAIVPFDAPAVNQPNTDGYLRDDELNQYLTSIRTALGPTGSLWLLFDSCHSQTLNRGKTAHQRGGIAPLGLSKRTPKVAQKSSEAESAWYETPTTRIDQAPYVLFAATTDGSPSFDTTDTKGQSVGPLTRAVGDAWRNLTPGETYRTFFNRVAVAMAQFAPYQQPTVEGDVNMSLATCSPQHTAGTFFRTRGETIRITWPRTDTYLTQLLTALPFVQPAATRPDIRIARRGRGYTIAANNQPLATNLSTADDCVERIRQYFARNVLLNLHQTNPDFQVQATLQRLAVHTENGKTTVTDTLLNRNTSGVPSFQVSATERMGLRLTNIGTKPFYITVVDLLPDGDLHVLLPEAGHVATDYQIQPGQSIRRRIRLTEPFGAEVYKLLLTPAPIDLRSVLQTRGSQPPQHPYETLFQRTYTTRGQSTSASVHLTTLTGATSDVAFYVEL